MYAWGGEAGEGMLREAPTGRTGNQPYDRGVPNRIKTRAHRGKFQKHLNIIRVGYHGYK